MSGLPAEAAAPVARLRLAAAIASRPAAATLASPLRPVATPLPLAPPPLAAPIAKAADPAALAVFAAPSRDRGSDAPALRRVFDAAAAASAAPSPVAIPFAAAASLGGPRSSRLAPSGGGSPRRGPTPRQWHAGLSAGGAAALIAFSAYRLVTDMPRKLAYQAIAIASQHQHAWTPWELFDMGGFNDLLTVPAIVASLYIVMLTTGGVTKKDRANDRKILLLASLAVTLMFELWFAHSLSSRGWDLINIVCYAAGGLLAAAASPYLWLPHKEAE